MRRSNHGIWLVWGITALIGTGWHFLYDWLPFQLVGMVAPVNESVWEHLKLLFWPFLLACPCWCSAAEMHSVPGARVLRPCC